MVIYDESLLGAIRKPFRDTYKKLRKEYKKRKVTAGDSILELQIQKDIREMEDQFINDHLFEKNTKEPLTEKFINNMTRDYNTYTNYLANCENKKIPHHPRYKDFINHIFTTHKKNYEGKKYDEQRTIKHTTKSHRQIHNTT